MSTTPVESDWRWKRIAQAVEAGGPSKSSLYNLAKLHPGLFRKVGRSTFVDMRMLDKIITAAPPAELATAS